MDVIDIDIYDIHLKLKVGYPKFKYRVNNRNKYFKHVFMYIIILLLKTEKK